MRTLLYADWSVAKGAALRSVAAGLLVLMPLVLMSNDEMPVSPAVIAAPIFVSMTLFATCSTSLGWMRRTAGSRFAWRCPRPPGRWCGHATLPWR